VGTGRHAGVSLAVREGQCTPVQPRVGWCCPTHGKAGLEGSATAPRGMHSWGHLLSLCTRSYRLSPMYLNSFSSRCHFQWVEKADLHTMRVSWGHVQVSWQKYCREGSTACTLVLPLPSQLINLYAFPLLFLLYLVSTHYQSNPQI